MLNTEGNPVWALTRYGVLKYARIFKLAIVALSVRPPGVNELCVYELRVKYKFSGYESIL